MISFKVFKTKSFSRRISGYLVVVLMSKSSTASFVILIGASRDQGRWIVDWKIKCAIMRPISAGQYLLPDSGMKSQLRSRFRSS
jgi:hypothetical protein